jgi:UDP-N-acetylglucosamine diphosphorylase / glucose-1-phosphate thymidylyltransferase / UDP-N-acetylgalactosamine diphosphorylase / glucosamine-1-phosphate N-acetyltransferase / galactosamine-1-phosphate N-acetyltransferase
VSAAPALVLFDDAVARRWRPFTLTRPAGELLFGTCTLRARAERVLGLECIGHLAAPHLADYEEHDAPGVLDALPTDRDVLLLCSRAVPAWTVARPRPGGAPGLVTVGGVACGWYAPAGSTVPAALLRGWLEEGVNGPREAAAGPGADAVIAVARVPASAPPGAAPALRLEGQVLERLWQLIHGNGGQIARDVSALCGEEAALPLYVHQLGAGGVYVGEGVELEPGVVLDTRAGPVWIDDGAIVQAYTRLAGPAYLAPGAHLLGGRFCDLTAGPHCRLHGEVEASVILGYTNKAHEGFLGHAYLGRWVNLGAFTTVSDLKNNYHPVRIWTPDGEVDTGELKMGPLLGDHVRTGIGLLLNTGTVVGAAANLFGSVMPPKHVPPFSWGEGEELVDYAVEKFLETTEIAMSRRNVQLTPRLKAQLRTAHRVGRAEEAGDGG